MLSEFKNLNEQETSLLLEAPALISILIAGADGEINKKEIDWGAKIAHFRSENENSVLQNYYREVDKMFIDTLEQFLSTLPQDIEERKNKINSELSKLNDVFKKLDKSYASELYKSFLSLAKHVAQSSGGIWGFGSISPEEQKMLGLEMINNPSN